MQFIIIVLLYFKIVFWLFENKLSFIGLNFM